MTELMVERTFLFEDELKRDFRPFEVVEGNFLCTLPSPVSGRLTTYNRRQRRVRYISHDQNSIRETVDDRGPATADGQFVMPCGGAVEMAEAWDQIEALKERSRALTARQAMVKPYRDEAWFNILAQMQEQEVEDFHRRSVSGPGLTVQRS